MNVELFLATLPIMAKGMAGIFIVTLVIIGLIMLMNHFTASTNKDKKQSELFS